MAYKNFNKNFRLLRVKDSKVKEVVRYNIHFPY